MKIYYKSEDLNIRNMCESDIDQIGQMLQNQGWHFDRTIFELYLSEQEKEVRVVLIAEFQNRVAGFVTLVPFTSIGPYKEMRIPEVVNFCVFIEYQKRGIGTKLMDVVELVATGMNTAISLAVGLHNGYGSAQRMYVKRGYVPDGSGVWYNGKNHEQYADCNNDDDLVLYLKKELN